MTTRITLDDICESTNTLLRHARMKAANSSTVLPDYSDAYVIGYTSSFIEMFIHSQPLAVQQAFMDAVADHANNLQNGLTYQ